MQFNQVSPALALAAAAALLSGPARSAGAATIDFESEPHGRVIDSHYHSAHGLTIEGHNWRGGPDYALVFDTRLTGTADPDLEDPWDGGNLALANVGHALIIAENIVDANGDTLIDSPDDQAVPVGKGASGQFVFKFDKMQTSFGFDLLDIDGPSEISPQVGYVSFMRWGVEKARVSFAELTNLASAHYDPTIVFGDNYANHVSPFTAAELGMTGFNGVAVAIGSGAIDNVTFSKRQHADPRARRRRRARAGRDGDGPPSAPRVNPPQLKQRFQTDSPPSRRADFFMQTGLIGTVERSTTRPAGDFFR